MRLRDLIPHLRVFVLLSPVVDVDLLPGRLLDEVDGLLDGIEVANGQQVELDEPELLQDVLVELGDHVSVLFGSTHRKTCGQSLARRDDHASSMLPERVDSLDELVSHLEEARVLVSEGSQLLLEDGVQLGPLHPQASRVGLSVGDDGSQRIVVNAEVLRQLRPRRRGELVDDALGLEPQDRADDGDLVVAVALTHVGLHDLLLRRRVVDVEVGKLSATLGHEPLEDQLCIHGVDVDDVRQVRHEAASS